MTDTAQFEKAAPLGAQFLFEVARVLARTPMRRAALPLLNYLKAKRFKIQGVDAVKASLKYGSGQIQEALEMLKEELRLFPANNNAARQLELIQAEMQKKAGVAAPVFCQEFEQLFLKIRPHTMVSKQRLHALFAAARAICAGNISGNFVECGVAAGGSSALLAYVIKNHSKEKRTLYAFDTFEGLPSPGAEDVRRGVSASRAGWGEGTCAAPVSCLREIAEDLGVWDRIVPVEGLFQETLLRTRGRIGEIALLHMDGDWYESTKVILDSLYDSVAAGGYVQVDDYGCWEGCRQALDEFEQAKLLVLSKTSIDSSGICFSKPS
jgi:O-methyltransferase